MALVLGLCVLVVGLAIVSSYREEIRASYTLWKNFERLGNGETGYPEYRHRTTGMVFVKLPGGKVFVPTYDPPRVEIPPFLIAVRTVQPADWERVLGSSAPRADVLPPPGSSLPIALVRLESCQDFCAEAELSLPIDGQLEHARDRLASIFENASDLRPVREIVRASGSGPVVVERSVQAGFRPVFNLFVLDQDIADQQSRAEESTTAHERIYLQPAGVSGPAPSDLSR